MRTQDEIVARYHERREHDLLGFEVHEYLLALDWEHVRPLLKDGAQESSQPFKTDDDVRARMADYIDFAYRKCFDRRGISACRSIMHYEAWIWLIGDDELLAKIDAKCERDGSDDYGESVLDLIAEHYGYAKTPRDPADMPPRNAELIRIVPNG